MATFPPHGKKDTVNLVFELDYYTNMMTLKRTPNANGHQELSRYQRTEPLTTSYLTRQPIQSKAKQTKPQEMSERQHWWGMSFSSEDPSPKQTRILQAMACYSTGGSLSGNFSKSRISRHSRYFLGKNNDKYCLKMEIPPYHFYFLYFNTAFQGSDKIVSYSANVLFLVLWQQQTKFHL